MVKSVKVGAYKNATTVLVKTITNLHVGVGQSAGIVDLPVQRDSLGFPNIPSSSIKGALKAHVQRNCEKCAKNIFGPHPEERETFAGAFAVLDALLLTFPVRSLKGVYCHVTSPLLLERTKSYLDLLSTVESKKFDIIEKVLAIKPSDSEVYVVKEEADSIRALNNSAIFNEEYVLELKNNNELTELAKILGLKRLAVVSDNLALALMEKSLIRSYRVRLKSETKTVVTGGLWSEESVPRETYFLTTFLYSDLRAPEDIVCEHFKNGQSLSVKSRFEELCLNKDKNEGYLIFGGHETIGHGLVMLQKLG